MVETSDYGEVSVTAGNSATIDQILRNLEEKCKKCKPLTALTCISECKTWKLKNEIRKMHEKISRPNYLEFLLNTLKNRRRLELLCMISRDHCSMLKLQQKMSSLGYKHSQRTIFEEYIQPLVDVGLVHDTHNTFYLTVLGCKVNELLKDFRDLGDTLPPHSDCYEEKALDSMLRGPKTYEELREIIPRKTAARVLSRLQRAGLVETRKDKSYIFFFKTKRCPLLEDLSSTENRVYQNIPEEGICAKILANMSSISLRRSYKYLRKLKGKKLVFERKRPLAYGLTDRGRKLALMFKTLRDLTVVAKATSDRFLKERDGAGSDSLETQTATGSS
jgi:predicted transcriptional regulator